MTRFFVTGTDTGIGKTLVSAILTSVLTAHYWKPIQSGTADDIADTQTVKNLTGLADTHFHESSYEFAPSLSPHHAAELENIKIDLSRCVLPELMQPLIVEGAGGVFVPVNDHETMLDLMKQLQLPVIVVARGTLGTINHTLLTLEVLRQRNIAVHGVIFSGHLNPPNVKTIEQWGGAKILFHVPFMKDVNHAELQKWLKQEGKAIHDSLTTR